MIAWSFKEKLEQDLGADYWKTIKKELWSEHHLTISEIIQSDYSIFHEKISSIIGKKGARKIQKKCMEDILSVHKKSQFYKLSFYDEKLGALIREAYADETSRKILNELTENVKCLPEISCNYNFKTTSFYRSVKKLIKSGLIIDTQKPIRWGNGDLKKMIPQYTTLFSQICIAIGKEANFVTGTITKETKKNSVILNVIENI